MIPAKCFLLIQINISSKDQNWSHWNFDHLFDILCNRFCVYKETWQSSFTHSHLSSLSLSFQSWACHTHGMAQTLKSKIASNWTSTFTYLVYLLFFCVYLSKLFRIANPFYKFRICSSLGMSFNGSINQINREDSNSLRWMKGLCGNDWDNITPYATSLRVPWTEQSRLIPICEASSMAYESRDSDVKRSSSCKVRRGQFLIPRFNRETRENSAITGYHQPT